MFVENKIFEAWMGRIMDRFDMLESRMTKQEKPRHKIDGELLLDNQDMCLMLNISKRTLQRYRSSGRLPFRRIEQKTYYKESDVHAFIRLHFEGNKSRIKIEK
ncbi:MAG: helix-turn-helix domain-containing protein [Bacteroidota bacterium]|nr:helix-turn-helix domain-containing protein [Bacteroidota bacterium]MDP4268505.1 helix-turn-helix domain-containing protein [Bacteroidota bacterium]